MRRCMTRQELSIEDLIARIRAAVPGAVVEAGPPSGPSGQNSIVVDPSSAIRIAEFLRDDPDLALDFLSNATGVDWPEREEITKEKVLEVVDGEEHEVVKESRKTIPGFLESVYHLYSIRHKTGPVVVRIRTTDRAPRSPAPSLTPVYKSAELQEREIFDLFGIGFTGHPDLRRLLMWENFADYPMRKDYMPPDDFDYEPTPHEEIERKAKAFDWAASAREALGPAPEGSADDAAPHAPMPEDASDQLLQVSLGPHHPSTHGVFRMNVTLDGETVVRLKPVFGYLHRNHEQLAEGLPYLASMPYTDRLDYFCSLTNNQAYAIAVEKLAGLEVTERAEYLRVICAELTRILNHTCFFGFFLGDMGGWGTVLMYAFREREKILDLFEELTGSRMMGNYLRFGGCRCDAPPGWLKRVNAFVDQFPPMLEEIEKLTATNEILVARTKGVGVVSGERAVQGGLSGPVLRASGVAYDVRKADSYGIYDRFSFRVPVGTNGDCYDRFLLRLAEIRESLGILKQALKDIPEGPVVNPKVKPRAFRPPVGEAYGRIEAPKGELGFYLISNGTDAPYRYRVRPPSLINLTLLEEMCLGTRIADVMVILGSIDIVLGEVDR